jgi:DNA-binding FadR family transcriptional regulator
MDVDHAPRTGVEKQVLSQHRQILNALRVKDAQLSRNSMRLHLEETGGLLIRIKSAART